MNDEQLLYKYRDSLKVAWGYNDYNDWPIRIASIMHLFADIFAEEFVADLDKLWRGDESAAEIGKLFEYPGRIFRLIDVVLFGLRRKRVALQEQHQFIIKMIKSAATLKSGDIFSEDGTNPLLGVQYPTKWVSADAVTIHRLQAALFAYTEATLFRGHDATKAVHGPYLYHDGLLVYREYHNLCPDVLWDRSLLLSVQSVQTVCHYTAASRVRVDNFDHMYHQGNLRNCLVAAHVEINGQAVEDTQYIIELTKEIIAKTKVISDMVTGWHWREKVKKYAEIFWFRKAPLNQRCGRGFFPPDQVFKQIEEGTINELRSKCLSPEQVARLIQLVI
ncbi:hypothetical protein ACN92M_23915 [Paenibacillus polymyxa]|uniref:hypothetical protein n=1 Tax=Paenibacillus polymyxa TaxID=1406 RepID=UPI000FAD42ED|nr:hypothetical protein H6F38_20425 [Paenibacillus sp. EKM208P]